MSPGHFVLHELDTLALMSLAIKAANSKSTKNDTVVNDTDNQNTEIQPNPENNPPKGLDGGTNKSIYNKMTTEDKITTKDDIDLQTDINRILNNESITCQTKTDQIIDLIYRHRRQKVLDTDREKLPPAQSRLLLQGGSLPETNSLSHKLTDDRQIPENKEEVKLDQNKDERKEKLKIVPKKENDKKGQNKKKTQKKGKKKKEEEEEKQQKQTLKNK